jgi:hypothetical protein
MAENTQSIAIESEGIFEWTRKGACDCGVVQLACLTKCDVIGEKRSSRLVGSG